MKNIQLPGVIFGTSGLGNLYTALPAEVKQTIVAECVKHAGKPVVFDSAGKYGAGLALEALGQCLKEAGVKADDVLISNKLGWLRVPLTTPEPTFEPGVWKDLQFDAVQQISYDGILACYKQGNELLGNYNAQLISVHDPDEYLATASSDADRSKRYQDVLDAYRALQDLKQQGSVKAVGIGSKDWRVIQQISQDVKLDWVMIANSMTIHSHPADLLSFMSELEEKGISIINSAVFNGGFLTGLDFYNYRPVSPQTDPELYQWRDDFYAVCKTFDVRPEVACVEFGRKAPGVKSIALNTTNPKRVEQNAKVAQIELPAPFWKAVTERGLIDATFAEKYLY